MRSQLHSRARAFMLICCAVLTSCSAAEAPTEQTNGSVELFRSIHTEAGFLVVASYIGPFDNQDASSVSLVVTFNSPCGMDPNCVIAQLEKQDGVLDPVFNDGVDAVEYRLGTGPDSGTCRVISSPVAGSGRMRDEVESQLPEDRTDLWRSSIECPQ